MLDILIRAGSFIAIIVMGYLLKKIGFFRQEDFLDTRPMSSDDFFFDAAYGQDRAAQGNFAGHGDIVADGFARQGRCDGRRHGDTC